MSFKRLLIFPIFTEQIKLIKSFIQLNISLNQYNPGQLLADVITRKIWLEKEDDKLFKQDICCFGFCSYFLVLISILLNIGKER